MTTLETNLARLAELKVIIDAGRDARQEFDAVKAEVATELLASQSDRSKPYAGVYATITRKDVPWISDSEELLHWFIRHDYPERDYMTDPAPDIEKIAQVAKDLVDVGDGELIPGLDYRTVESLSVRTVKEKK